jgi:hypothetical protein
MTEKLPWRQTTRSRTLEQSELAVVPRWVLLLPMLLTASIVGGAATFLSHAAGNNVPASVLAGGAAFAGSLGLLLAIAHFTFAA